MRALTASLRLVVPPISNQEADRIKREKSPRGDEMREALKSATIYMIAQRQEIFFDETEEMKDSGVVRFALVLGERRLRGAINPAGIAGELGDPSAPDIRIDADRKYLKVFDVNADGEERLIWAVSPDAFLFQAWRGFPHQVLAGDARELATYRLLYIGMSEDGAYKRLIHAPHHARLDILTNELQVRAEARVSDEIFFFMFAIDPLQIRSWGPDDEVTDEHIEQLLSGDGGLPPAKLISDVEKAFISMLATPYNRRRYHNYPNIADGIADLGFTRYAYAIAEDISFDVQGQRVDGGYSQEGLPASNSADFILVQGDEVSLIDISEALEVDFDAVRR
jgi:hypothetical protein